MASAFSPIIKSFDESALMNRTDKPVRCYAQKDGRNIGFAIKRRGSHTPKKPRNA